MPLGVQSGNVVFHDGAVAAVALRREHVEVVGAAVRLAVALMEALFAELLAALGAEEVLCVPCLVQCGDAFLQRKRANAVSNAAAGRAERVNERLRWRRCSRRSVG